MEKVNYQGIGSSKRHSNLCYGTDLRIVTKVQTFKNKRNPWTRFSDYRLISRQIKLNLFQKFKLPLRSNPCQIHAIKNMILIYHEFHCTRSRIRKPASLDQGSD